MGNKQQKTWRAIFANPIQSNVRWKDIENLFIYLGAEISEGSGSRVRIELNGVKAVFHRPHPHPETDKGALMSVRKFLSNSRIYYDQI